MKAEITNRAIEESGIFNENIVCPVTGEPLYTLGDRISTDSGHSYNLIGGIPMLYIDENEKVRTTHTIKGNHEAEITHSVQDFYIAAPFPNYNNFDDIQSFVRMANKGVFARLLGSQIPMNSNILEIGCGTAQLSNYLAATTLSRVYASDMTPASLRLGYDFAKRNNIESITFVQSNLFMPPFKAESMDIVIANGVLHHTYDTKKAFLSISRLVKPGGYIIIGLYNHIGRLRTDFRRVLVKYFGEWILFLDPHLRKSLSPEKRRAWINDQYYHPQERKHSISELMGWFEETGFQFVSSIPKIMGEFSNDEKLFEPKDKGTAFDRTLAEINMLFSHYGSEGGLFICIGRKRGQQITP